MISEDWSNDVENVSLITEINYTLKEIEIENHYFKCNCHCFICWSTNNIHNDICVIWQRRFLHLNLFLVW